MEAAGRLYKAGEDMRLGTDEHTFIEVLTRYSLQQLHDIFDQYAKVHVCC